MIWTAQIALAGGILATGPIIIHLLFRRRHRILHFAAMRFLFDALRRIKQRLRIEEIIVIALRVLICALLGFMLANIRAEALVAGKPAPTAHVFVLDDSLSMGQQAGTSTLFEKAVSGVSKLIQDLPDGDMVAVISACQPQSGKPLGHLALVRELKRDRFPSRLTALRPTDLRAKLPQALTEARKLLSSQKDLLARFYLASDFRTQDFIKSEEAAELRKAFSAVAGVGAEVRLLDYGLKCRSNVTIERATVGRKLLVAGVPAQIQVAVRNNSPEVAADANVSVQVGPVKLPSQTLKAIGPGQVRKVSFDYVFSTAGSTGVKVSVTPDALAADNEAYLAVHVRRAMRVLIVDGSDDPSSFDSASFCLSQAIDPSGRGEFSQKADVVRPEALPAESLDQYDVVFLTNVGRFQTLRDAKGKQTCPSLEALRRYVREGGGLIVFLGDKVSPEFYNGPFHEGGRGLSPLALPAGAPPKPDRSKYVRLRPDSISPKAEPILKIFSRDGGKVTRLVRFYVHVPVQESAEAEAGEGIGKPEVLARFDDAARSPALVHRSYGKGTVIMWYTAADTRWSDWPKSLSFLPVMNDMAWHTARAGRGQFHGQVGQKIRYPVPPGLADATAITLKTPAYPAEDLQMLQLRGEEGRKVASYRAAPPPGPGTVHAGLYEMEFIMPDRSRQKVLFSRQIDTGECDLGKANEPQIAMAVGCPHKYRGGLAKGLAAIEEEPPRMAYWWLFMAAILALLPLELYLARRFGHYATGSEGARRGEIARGGPREPAWSG